MKTTRPGLALVAAMAFASVASALPIELRDSNGTRYNINSEVSPLITNSFASGAVTNATYEKPVTVTSYFLGLTPFGFFLTTYTVQRQVNIPLTPAFAGFNGLVLAGSNGEKLPQLLPYNPAQPIASDDCPQNGKNRQLIFQPQSFPALNLQVQRQVFVNNNNPWVRWLNIVTNTGTAPNQVGIGLQGLLGSLAETRVTATSSGDSTINAEDLWWTTREQAPTNGKSTEPAIGFGVQGAGASVPARSIAISSAGQATAVFTPTIQPGQSAVILTFGTVQGNNKDAKNAISKVIGLPSGAIQCIPQALLKAVVNFAPITPPKLKNATIKLNFQKTGQDTVQWKGKINLGAGTSLQNLPVTVDVGGVTQAFVLNKKGMANAGGGNKFSLDATLKNGVTKAATDVSFSFNLKGDFQATLAAYDLTNATANAPVTIPVTFTAGPDTRSPRVELAPCVYLRT